MDFYMYHGRIDPKGSPQAYTRTVEGVQYSDVDDWGFEGRRLSGVIGFHCTYGPHGHFNLYFEDDRAAKEAQRVTGWDEWEDNALTVRFSPEYDQVRIDDPAFGIPHYFGDWGIK